MKHIIILGGGITGLSLAWFLKRQQQERLQITVLEKTERVGGWIQSVEQEGFHFELGPHSIRTSGADRTLALVEALRMQEQIIVPASDAYRRYLLINKKLREIPSDLKELFTSPLARDFFIPIAKDLFSGFGPEEETIYDFSMRHFGRTFTHRYIDALVTGIYAGKMQELSVQSCFPLWHKLEKDYGSMIRGWIFKKKKRERQSLFVEKIKKAPFFSFYGGMEALPKTLLKQIGQDVLVKSEVAALQFDRNRIEILLEEGECLRADHLISTIPPHALADLLAPHSTVLGALLTSIESASVVTASLGFRKSDFAKRGFGYLVPSEEKESVLGMIWDSSLFPQQNGMKEETRLTVMMGGAKQPDLIGLNNEALQQIAIQAAAEHLQIDQPPDSIYLHRARKAIPQYVVGHREKVKHIHNELKRLHPCITCLGSAFNGVSINDCIAEAERIACNYSSE